MIVGDVVDYLSKPTMMMMMMRRKGSMPHQRRTRRKMLVLMMVLCLQLSLLSLWVRVVVLVMNSQHNL